MFVRMLTVHCDQNDSYEITIKGFQVRKINEIRNVIFGLRFGKPSSAVSQFLNQYWFLFTFMTLAVFFRLNLCMILSYDAKMGTFGYSIL